MVRSRAAESMGPVARNSKASVSVPTVSGEPVPAVPARRAVRASRIFCAGCSAAARAVAADRHAVRNGSFGASAGGQDIHASLTITLGDAAKGTKTRVHLPTGKDVEVKIPAGIASGQQIRLKGQGWPSASGRAGDALITINVAPHQLFKPDGADLRLELPITLYEAVLGGKVRVTTLDGAVELAIPAGTEFRAHFPPSGQGTGLGPEGKKRRR